jgi:peptidyl-prolyl cis-trans isomerase B (cyclophilin B)
MKMIQKEAFALAIVLSLLGGSMHSTTPSRGAKLNYKPPISESKLPEYTAFPKRRLVIVTAQGTIKLQLFEKIAPNHVANIIDLANSDFYNSTYFHRVIPGFMIQGGDPNTKDDDFSNDGQGNNGSNRLIAEFSEVHHARGILSMARAADPNSASCQFFICVAEAASLDRKYTVFGQVTDGIEVVDAIVNLPDATNRSRSRISNEGGTNPGRAAEVLRMFVENDGTDKKAEEKFTPTERKRVEVDRASEASMKAQEQRGAAVAKKADALLGPDVIERLASHFMTSQEAGENALGISMTLGTMTLGNRFDPTILNLAAMLGKNEDIKEYFQIRFRSIPTFIPIQLHELSKYTGLSYDELRALQE